MDQLHTESEAAPGRTTRMKKIAEDEEAYNSPQEESESWQPDFSVEEDEEEEDLQFEDAPPQEILGQCLRLHRKNLTAKKYGHDASDAEMTPPPIGSTPLHRTRAASTNAEGAKRKEFLEPKPKSPAPN